MRSSSPQSSSCVTALLLLVASLCPAQQPDQRIEQIRIEQIIESQVKSGRFMGSVLVAKGDAVLLNKGYGSANLEWNIPNSPDIKFRLGSITKQFTAACILILQERGKLKIENPIKTYMPDAPAAWDKVTIHHVLTHTSGIPSFTEFPDYPASEAKSTTPQELVNRFREKPLEFEPGSSWKYSNSGYVLLGYLIEKISGMAYKDFVQQNIFTPLGMTDSGYDSNQAVILHRASGYSQSAHGIVNAGYIDMTIPFSAGALYSTTTDLLKWERGLFEQGKVLSGASLAQRATPFKSDDGFGLMIHTSGGRKEFEHGGGIEGFNTELSYWPDEKLTVIVLGNLNGNAPGQIASQIEDVLHGKQIVLTSERKEIQIPAAILTSYQGTYELAPNVNFEITLVGDHLEAQLTGQPRLPIFAESKTLFFYKAVDAQLEFTLDNSGRPTQLTLHQNGRDVVCKKK